MVKTKAVGSYEKHLANLSQLLQNLWETDDLESQIAAALEYLKTEYKYTLLWVGFYDRFKHQLITKGIYHEKGNHFGRQPMELHPGDLMEQVVVQQRPMVIADLQSESRAGEWAPIAAKFKLQGTAIFPLRRKDRCFGVLVLGSNRWGLTPSAIEKSTLFTVANALAKILYHQDTEQQRQQIKQPSKPLLTLLETIEAVSGLEERLQLVADETQQFIGAAQTSIYWFEPQKRHFWHRLSNRKRTYRANETNNRPSTEPETLFADDLKGFYQALSNGELVVLGEVDSSLKASMIGRLTAHLKAQSLLAAPISSQGELLGFLAVEGHAARIWSDPEKQYIRGAAQLIGLTMPASTMEDSIARIKANQLVTTGLARSIHSDNDWQKVLTQCADQLFEYIGAENLIVLLPDLDRGGFQIGYQSHRGNAKPAVRSNWRSLHDIDLQLVEQSQDPICIENLEDDLKLMAWRPRFLEMGVRAFMACNVSPGKLPEGILLVTDTVTRRWSHADQDLLRAVSQQIGLILHQWQLQRQADQQTQLHDTMQWGLRNLQRTFKSEQLVQTATHHIAQLLQVPMVVFLTWVSHQAKAQIADIVIREKSFAINEEKPILVKSDAIINWAIQTDGILPLSLEDLPDVTRQWLQGPHGCQLLLVALRTAPEHEPNGVILLADHSDRSWSDQQMTMLGILVNQLAWCRRHLLLTERLSSQRRQLAELNWYKQHYITEIHRQLESNLQRLTAFSFESNFATNQRYQQMMRQLQKALDSLNTLTTEESWALQTDYEKMPLVTLLNHLMDRMNALVQQKQLWTKVHCESNLTLGGDMQKIEFILFELIVGACSRSPMNGRIDIWSRQLDGQWLELSITDNGEVNPLIISTLAENNQVDGLVDSALDYPPGLHFAICKSIMKQLGGEFDLQTLEDRRTLSRVILPLTKSAVPKRIKPPTAELMTYKNSKE
jgi:GAF domain-containing protein